MSYRQIQIHLGRIAKIPETDYEKAVARDAIFNIHPPLVCPQATIADVEVQIIYSEHFEDLRMVLESMFPDANIPDEPADYKLPNNKNHYAYTIATY